MQHEHHRVPVTAVTLWRNDVILSGEGSLLKAYNFNTKSLLATVRVFDDQAVHGIVLGRNATILIWGGRCIRRAKFSFRGTNSGDFTLGTLEEASDWILDTAFPEESDKAVLVTAHNALLLATPCGPLDIKSQTLVPGSNCILYSAHASWLSSSKCLIASGTAFGDIIVWSCTITYHGDCFVAKHEIHYTFLAHEGSVFGLHIASLAEELLPGGQKHLLASCSDDRTVRVWDVSDLKVQSPALEEAQRQTGFGSQPCEDAFAPPMLSKAMGHLSRIWHVRFFSVPSDEVSRSLRMMTFGEDASVITWALETSDKTGESAHLRQLSSKKCHSGKNIWAAYLAPDFHAFTGGADGAISLRRLTNFKSTTSRLEVDTGVFNASEVSDNYRSYKFIGPSQMVASTDQGRLLMIDTKPNQSISTREISTAISGLRGYSVLASMAGFAFFAGSEGIVYSYSKKSEHVEIVIQTGRKVAGLFFPAYAPEEEQVETALLVTNVGATEATLLLLNTRPGHQTELVSGSIALTLPLGLVVTSFTTLRHRHTSFAVIGWRNGEIGLFDITDINNSKMLLSQMSHEKEAVTSLQAGQNQGHTDRAILYSTGRDGTYAVHKLEVTDVVTMVTIHKLSLPFGPNVEGLGFSPQGNILTWGFRSKQFVVFDVSNQQEIMTVDCGGAHRNWCYQIGEHGGTLVWTKSSKLYYATQTELQFKLLHSGGHGREIKSVAASPSKARLIATGAEDTDIKLHTYDNGVFRCLHTLQKHNTGIQHLQWSPDGTFLFSSGGFEEFFVWRISYDVPDIEIGVVCESKHPGSGTSDLRIMSFHANESKTSGELKFRIAMVYSDSTNRLWEYTSQSWHLLAWGDYLTSCLTQCLQLADAQSCIITTSTDGHVVEWKRDDQSTQLQWTSRHKVHQSAILSLAIHELSDGSRIVLTGGDDNAIGITRTTSSTKLHSLLVTKAHAAAITAITIVDTDSDGLWLVSASIDQRIKLWRININPDKFGVEGIDIKLIKNVFTAVADVSSVEKYQLSDETTGVLVCGVGMDIWRIETGKLSR